MERWLDDFRFVYFVVVCLSCHVDEGESKRDKKVLFAFPSMDVKAKRQTSHDREEKKVFIMAQLKVENLTVTQTAFASFAWNLNNAYLPVDKWRYKQTSGISRRDESLTKRSLIVRGETVYMLVN